MKYTTQSSVADQAIQNYLDRIVKVIREEIPQTKSIILGGGFGRGEGGVWMKGETAVPVNDFDMFVITDDKDVDEKRLNAVANQAALSLPAEIGPRGTDFYSFDPRLHAQTFYVDLKALPLGKLRHLPPMFRYVELKKASLVVWGQDYRDLMPDYAIQDLPLAEGFRLLLNRMALLCLYFSLDFRNRPLTASEKHGLLYLGSKSLVDLTAPLLQLNGKYRPTYLERLKSLKESYQQDFPSLYARLPDLVGKVTQATEFKLRPDFGIEINPFEYWTECKKYIGEVALYFGTVLFKTKVQDYSALAGLVQDKFWKSYYTPYLRHFLKSRFKMGGGSLPAAVILQLYINFLIYRRFKVRAGVTYPRVLANQRGFDLLLYTAMIYLLYSVDEYGKIDSAMLDAAKKTMEKVFPAPGSSWEAVRMAFSQAYANFSFLKLV